MTDAQQNREFRAGSRSVILGLGMVALIGLVLGSPQSAIAQKLATLYSFCSKGGSDCRDGSGPQQGLVQGSDGDLYGTTAGGGAGYGTVFKITPSGAFTKLWDFCSQSKCADGGLPYVALVQGSDGNLYGTTTAGGANGHGTIFKITLSGTLTTLYSFCSQGGSVCTDGYEPSAPLVQGSDGDFYGTTLYGGANLRSIGGGLHAGTVFKVTPSGAFTRLWDFCSQSNCTDGEMPLGGLVEGSDGNFYGTTGFGGGANNYGTVFEITSTGTLTTLYTFSQTNYSNGETPGGLVHGNDGNFYGTTVVGGVGRGTVFKISPTGTLTTLYSFCSKGQNPCTDGNHPSAALVQGSDGNLYGTTTGDNVNKDETIFRVTPSGKFAMLYTFCSQSKCTDGYGVQYNALVEGSDGNLYGTTTWGGANGKGTVFVLEVSPIAGE